MNSLYNQLNPQNQQVQNNKGIQQIIQMAKSGNNPQQLLNNLAGQNPQLNQAMQLINSGKITPKQLFMNMANQQGINPNDIISMLK